jgi:hypothetical protein
MFEDERMRILERLEKGEISAAQAEELLEALEAGEEEEEREAARGGGEFTDITQWSPRGRITELRVDSFIGGIAARAGEPTLVVATLRARARDADAARKLFDKVELTFQEERGTAHVKADMTKGLFDFLRGGKVKVDFDVTLPAEIPFVASYGTGPLTTRGLAAVSANFGNGNVETDAARLALNMGNGKVASRGARELDVNGGNVRLALEEADGLENFKFNAGNGRVDAVMKRLARNADYALNFGNGKVRLALARKPTDCLITFEALASKLETDLPFDKVGTKMTFADGEPKARLKVHAANLKGVITIEEDK